MHVSWKKWRRYFRHPAHLKKGRWGERTAERFLKKKGFCLIERNVRLGRFAEIDLIMKEADTLVFIEVKTRENEQFGRPFHAISNAQQRRISYAATHYIKRKHLKPDYIRIDVLEVVGDRSFRKKPLIRHIPDAWKLPSGMRLWW
tara:strand:+ start:6565 stop:6999 length:435 start_codon:yes stop_codon:yes gene_type:complete